MTTCGCRSSFCKFSCLIEQGSVFFITRAEDLLEQRCWFQASVLPCSFHSFFVKKLHCIMGQLFFFEPRQRNVHCLLSISNCLPPFFDNLASLLVAHKREFGLYLSSCLSFVNSIRTHFFELNPLVHVAFLLDLVYLSPYFFRQSLNSWKLLLVFALKRIKLILVLLLFYFGSGVPKFLNSLRIKNFAGFFFPELLLKRLERVERRLWLF